jgi:hypothetical protein
MLLRTVFLNCGALVPVRIVPGKQFQCLSNLGDPSLEMAVVRLCWSWVLPTAALLSMSSTHRFSSSSSAWLASLMIWMHPLLTLGYHCIPLVTALASVHVCANEFVTCYRDIISGMPQMRSWWSQKILSLLMGSQSGKPALAWACSLLKHFSLARQSVDLEQTWRLARVFPLQRWKYGKLFTSNINVSSTLNKSCKVQFPCSGIPFRVPGNSWASSSSQCFVKK